MLPYFIKAQISTTSLNIRLTPIKERYVSTRHRRGYNTFLMPTATAKTHLYKMPQRWAEAERQYSCRLALTNTALVPWTIQYYYYKLVQAFKDRDTMAILRTSANLGHYVADASVPLHMTENYNGQLSNQIGIHALWETRIPELYSDAWHYNVGRAHYIQSPLKEVWKISRRTFRCLDSVLLFERKLNAIFPADKKMVSLKRNGKKMSDYSPEYAAAYQTMLHGMVERQMRASILEIGCFWFSAWVDAGQPDLNKLTDPKLNPADNMQANKEQQLYQQGKVSPRTIK